MLQFFRLKKETPSEKEYRILSGSAAVKYLIKSGLWVLVFFYATFFLAVAVPFVKTPCQWIYAAGGFASVICLVRFICKVVKFLQYRNGFISVGEKGITVKNRFLKVTIPSSAVAYLEHSLLGNLVIHEKRHSTSFPLALITKEDRKALLEEFQDMSPKRSALFRKIWEILDAVAVALFLAVHIIQYIVQAYYIPTGSMEDTLLVGDHLFVEKISYGPVIPQMMFMDKPVHLSALAIRHLQRGDIVIFRPPHEEDKDYIKRCIGMPGDFVEFRNGDVYINGEKIDEPYTGGKPTYPGTCQVEGTVPEGQILVMGDNRTNSQDSRYFGYLDITRIKGKAFFLYWNTDFVIHGSDFSRFKFIK